MQHLCVKSGKVLRTVTFYMLGLMPHTLVFMKLKSSMNFLNIFLFIFVILIMIKKSGAITQMPPMIMFYRYIFNAIWTLSAALLGIFHPYPNASPLWTWIFPLPNMVSLPESTKKSSIYIFIFSNNLHMHLLCSVVLSTNLWNAFFY